MPISKNLLAMLNKLMVPLVYIRNELITLSTQILKFKYFKKSFGCVTETIFYYGFLLISSTKVMVKYSSFQFQWNTISTKSK